MQKETLRQLKPISATPTMVRLAKDNKHEMVYPTRWGVYKENTIYDLFIHCRTDKDTILRVCIFLPDEVARGVTSPLYEIYCNPQTGEYTTRGFDCHGKEVKWSGAMADNLEIIGHRINEYRHNGAFPGWPARIWQSQEGKKTIQDILKTEKKGILGLIEWQRKIKKEKMLEKERRQQEPWDRDMALVPEMFPSFYSWMEKDGHSNHYIFYTYDKQGAKEGYCSHCRRWVPIKRPRHNKKSLCIKCGVKITYKVTSKIKSLHTEWYAAQVIQKFRGGIVIKTFEQRQSYWNTDFKTPRKQTKEVERILLFDTGETKRYYYGLYKNQKERWIFDKNYIPKRHTYYESSFIKLYKRNLSALKKTVPILRKSTLDLWPSLPTDTANYLQIEHSRQEVEKLVKIGMFRLAEEFIRAGYKRNQLLDQSQTELAKMLKIDPARLKRLKDIGGNMNHLEWLQREKTADTVWPNEMIWDFGNSEFDPDSFDFIPLPMSLPKIWNYLKKQVQISNETMARLLETWRDYINMAQNNKMDVKNDMICRPKDIRAAHQRMVLLAQKGEMEKEAKKLEKKWPKVNGALPKLKKFEYADTQYAILAPENILDIVKEGHALQHCVHSCDFYFDRIQRDESYLFFLRRAGAEDTPWYTLEVEPSGNIRQKRTTGDNQNKDFEGAVAFLKKWQREFDKRLTKEEKRLGQQSEQARIREYAKLRKDGNKVWHGKLAGQLLADVLEQDFMAAGS